MPSALGHAGPPGTCSKSTSMHNNEQGDCKIHLPISNNPNNLNQIISLSYRLLLFLAGPISQLIAILKSHRFLEIHGVVRTKIWCKRCCFASLTKFLLLLNKKLTKLL